MSEQNTNTRPFPEILNTDGLDIDSIFGGGGTPAADSNPFDAPVASPPAVAEPMVELASTMPQVTAPDAPQQMASATQTASAAAENPIAAAFEQKTVENAQKGLLEKAPVFYHKSVKEPIEDPSMTFEELRIRKSEDFADLEEGKYVSWSVEYCFLLLHGWHGRLHDSTRYFACFAPYLSCRGPPEKVLSDTHAVAKREIDRKGYRYKYRDEKPRHGSVDRLPQSQARDCPAGI